MVYNKGFILIQEMNRYDSITSVTTDYRGASGTYGSRRRVCVTLRGTPVLAGDFPFTTVRCGRVFVTAAKAFY